MTFPRLALLATIALTGCASSATTEPAPTSAESDLAITPTRQAQLDALRARARSDFGNPPSLEGKKIVFVVTNYQADDHSCVIFGNMMKRDLKTGHDFELTHEDYVGSKFERWEREGLWDGPLVYSILWLIDGKWQVAKNLEGDEAYMVGPLDVAYMPWPDQFGVPAAWLGIPDDLQ